MGIIIQVQGIEGYANGFVAFFCLAVIYLLLVGILKRERAGNPSSPGLTNEGGKT